MADITIIHTNDMHNRFDESCRDTVSRLKRESDALVLDAGDAVWAGNVYYRPGGEPVLDLMSAAGYDAMTLGNREFHFTETGLKCKLRRSSYTVLCANIRPSGSAGLPSRPSMVIERNGCRVGIVGVTVAMVKARMRTASVSAYVFDDPISTAVEQAGELRGQCDLLVALTHIGLRGDKEIAEKTDHFDLIIGGHSHHELAEPVHVGNTPIVQTGCYAHNYGVCEISRSGAGWGLAYRLEPLKGRRS